MKWLAIWITWEWNNWSIASLSWNTKDAIFVTNTLSFTNLDQEISEFIQKVRRRVFELWIMSQREGSELSVCFWFESSVDRIKILKRFLKTSFQTDRILSHAHFDDPDRIASDYLHSMIYDSVPYHANIEVWRWTFWPGPCVLDKNIPSSDLTKLELFRDQLPQILSDPDTKKVRSFVLEAARNLSDTIEWVRPVGSKVPRFRVWSNSVYEEIRDIFLCSHEYGEIFAKQYILQSGIGHNLSVSKKGERNPPFANITLTLMADKIDRRDMTLPSFVSFAHDN